MLRKLTGKIEVLTGLHIGSGRDTIGIGGIDSPVMKDRQGYPYIPGSSLKGKIRSLLADGKEIKDEPPEVKTAFGTQEEAGRVIFYDSFLSGDDREYFQGDKKGRVVEEKTETAIDRSKGSAKGGSLRSIERTTTGIFFDFEIVLKNEADFDLIKRGLELLEGDYLGGMGTRGYGRVKVVLDET